MTDPIEADDMAAGSYSKPLLAAAMAVGKADMDFGAQTVPRWSNFTEHAKMTYLEVARVAIAAYLKAQWQPIETAPKMRKIIVDTGFDRVIDKDRGA